MVSVRAGLAFEQASVNSSGAEDLVSGDTNLAWDIFVRDRQSARWRLRERRSETYNPR